VFVQQTSSWKHHGVSAELFNEFLVTYHILIMPATCTFRLPTRKEEEPKMSLLENRFSGLKSHCLFSLEDSHIPQKH